MIWQIILVTGQVEGWGFEILVPSYRDWLLFHQGKSDKRKYKNLLSLVEL
jgi:hypothetical protein